MNKKEIELLCIPLAISLLIVIILHNVLGDMIKINNFDIIISSYISFVGTLVGFLITTITIVIGFFDKKIIKIILRSEKEKILYLNWITTIIVGIFSILFTFYLAAVFDNNAGEIQKVLLEIIIFLTINFIGYLTMSLIYFFGIAMSVMKENNKEEKEIPKLDPDKIRNPNSKK
ncbi:MAG: hypothetical protein HFJ34_05240 [Clostridia bacterium]|nr:hypothetical protein [Clostridia bacterium]